MINDKRRNANFNGVLLGAHMIRPIIITVTTGTRSRGISNSIFNDAFNQPALTLVYHELLIFSTKKPSRVMARPHIQFSINSLKMFPHGIYRNMKLIGHLLILFPLGQ
jgi:hypothetical protein